MDNKLFYKNLEENLSVFEGCGNMLGIVPLSLAGYKGGKNAWKKDRKLRSLLTKWGKEIKSDSVMVLAGDPLDAKKQGYHVEMFVFEPRGKDDTGMGGCISTMCGNGVRAVAAWIREYEPGAKDASIMTMSGLRKIAIEGDLYTVEMGELTMKAKDLRPYIDTRKVLSNEAGEYVDSEIPEEILKKLSQHISTKTWSIGLNGTRDKKGKIDGEPHIVIEIPKKEAKNIKALRKIAVKAGPIITKNKKLFPKEINANFVVVEGKKKEKLVVWNCTHERNLGSDADHSVTAACGTGSTVVGGVMFTKYTKKAGSTVLVKFKGGEMQISVKGKKKNPMTLLMKGPARRVKK